MSWQQVFLIGFFAVGVFSTVMSIDKPRKPITPGGAAFTLIVAVLLMYVVVTIH